MFNQGFVVYETTVKQRKSYFQAVMRDYALIFVDGVYLTSVDRSETTVSDFAVDCQQATCTLRIVVQAMGHINFDHQMEQDYKGLVDITDNIGTSFQWNMYKLPIDNNMLKWDSYNASATVAPTLLKATVSLD